jgi:hypothetical protein
MPDGHKRARRNGERGLPRQKWYASYRAIRFNRRFGLNANPPKDSNKIG